MTARALRAPRGYFAEMIRAGTAARHWNPRRAGRSEDLVARQPDHVRAEAAVGLDAAQAVPPFECEQRADRRRRLERRADTGVVAKAAAESRVVYGRGVEETVDADR